MKFLVTLTCTLCLCHVIKTSDIKVKVGDSWWLLYVCMGDFVNYMLVWGVNLGQWVRYILFMKRSKVSRLITVIGLLNIVSTLHT